MPIDKAFLVPGGALRGQLFSRMAGERHDAPVLAAGTQIGNYRIQNVIGSGGASVVYRAQRCDGTFEQVVALKVVRANPKLQEHSRRERNLLAQFSDSRIARIYDGGETADGAIWFAMELVEGTRIDDFCAVGKLPWDARVRLLLEVCAAVQHAHQHLVVHRDIKPSNIVVTDLGIPKLLDFGISRVLDDGSEETEIAYTPGFASPEQIRGAAPTTASDIFQIGRLTAVLLDPAECADNPPPPKLVLRNIRAVVERATAASPLARYATVTDLCNDLRCVLQLRPGSAGAWSPTQRIAFALARHPLAFGIGMSLLLAATAISGYVIQLTASHRALREREMQDAEIGKGFLFNLLRAGSVKTTDKHGPGLLQILQRGDELTFQLMDAQPATRVSAIEALVDVYINLGMRERAQSLVRRTLDDFQAHHPERVLERARLATALAKCINATSDLASLEAAVRDAEKWMALAKVDAGSGLRLALGRVQVPLLERQNRIDDSLQLADTLLADAERAGLSESAQFAGVLYQRGQMRWIFQHDGPRALADLGRSLDILETLFGPGNASVGTFTGLWAEVAAAQGDIQGAIRRTAQREHEAKVMFGDDSVEYARAAGFAAIVLFDWADDQAFAPALAKLKTAYALIDAQDPASFFARTLAQRYALALLRNDDAPGALQILRRLHAAGSGIYSQDHPLQLQLGIDLAAAECAGGLAVSALARLDDADAKIQALPRNPVLAAHYWLQRAECLRIAGHTEQARTLAATKLSPALVATLPTRLRRTGAALLALR